MQWKGTEACIDWQCGRCGEITHTCTDFDVSLECPKCGTTYRLQNHITIVEYEGMGYR